MEQTLMPKLSDHQSNKFTKLLLSGDSGSGKSGALTSLVKAGYQLRILDMDNGLDSLKAFVMKECPDMADNVEFRTLRDHYKSANTGVIVEKPRAWVDMMKMLDNWKYDDIDLGKPPEWGPEYIVVVDSLTFASDAAFNWARALNPGSKDPRQWFYAAQQQVEAALALLFSETFRTNVIVISHIRYSTNDDGTTKGYPNSIGSAIGPTIPTYFNHWAQCENKAGKRSIRTAATSTLDLKNSKPFEMEKTYDISTGLADFFAVLREPPAKPEPPVVAARPKALTLQRKL